MHLIDGKKIADEIREGLKQAIARSGKSPGLGVVLVGELPESVKYVNSKERAASEVGISFNRVSLPSGTPKSAIIAEIEKLNVDQKTSGIIVQLPIPGASADDTAEIIGSISENKDADGMTVTTRKSLNDGKRKITPVLTRVVLECIKQARITTEGKNIAMVVKSLEPYESFKTVLEKYEGAKTSRIHPDDPELGLKLREADVIVSLPGRPGIITKEMVKPGAVVIDYDYPLASVDFDSIKEIASAITPVPGGCGPMTVAYLLANVYELSQHAERK